MLLEPQDGYDRARVDPIVIILAVSTISSLGAAAWLASRQRTTPPAPGEEFAKLVGRVTDLERERPRFVAEMNGLLDECEELLDRTKRKKAAIDGKKAHETAETGPSQPELQGDDLDRRRAAKAAVLARFG